MSGRPVSRARARGIGVVWMQDAPHVGY